MVCERERRRRQCFKSVCVSGLTLCASTFPLISSDAKMDDGLLSLKWNNHKITFFEILRVLREKANYTDATIAVEGKFYPVHKLVMSTCSEYFSEIFERTPCKSPVIVLKDVRSQDMDALLDYMYLGEVNVNQNDLASLLKTAECLRIKGLAVPDEDPTKSRKPQSDDRRESPPPKRRRHEDNSVPPPQQRPVSPTVSASLKTAPPSRTPPLQHQTASLPVSQTQDSVQDSGVDPPPMVKVEMEDADDPDDGYRRDNSYDGGSVNEGDGDFGAELSKSEHDPETYGSSSFPGPSIQPGGDLPWDEGDSSSFPPEGFSGDLPAGQQPQGGGGWSGRTSALPVSQARLSEGFSTLPGNSEGCSGMYSVLPGTTAGPGASNIMGATCITWSKRSSTDEGSSGAYSALTGISVGSDASDPRPAAKWIKRSTANAVCSVCFKDFMYPSALVLHMRSHTGEKPFTCPHPQCDYRSTKKGNLKRHASTHGEAFVAVLEI
ncbi:broad-complex core protein isoforms 1/2/3/4/5 isoform X5 [Procambarus clarkii]|uniref:broad-complex core protein isoforms 1/2/3/4/5 isoform X5 n=1 Tax=Procambarus clarkii TaxID=6728 RepID=UPI001E67382B|nr:broad-complex core protein isoforms 1/2/3/4/5-like isoform X4 [Procambarus clarkii]